jgi:hypothetical protein
MGKLYVLIYLAGKLVGTIGPLPYEMDECLERSSEKMTIINRDTFKRDGSHANDLELRCEYRLTRPVLDDGTEGVQP